MRDEQEGQDCEVFRVRTLTVLGSIFTRSILKATVPFRSASKPTVCSAGPSQII